MSPQHHFSVLFFLIFFFHPYCWCHLHCWLNINRCWSAGGGGRRRRRGDSRGSCVPRLSRLSVHLTLSPHLLQFWLPPGLFVHLYLCFFPLLFLCPPSFSGGEAEEWSVRLWCRWPLPWLFHSTWAQAITKALLADCYYSVMLLSGAGGRRRGGGGGEAGPSGVIGKVIK